MPEFKADFNINPVNVEANFDLVTTEVEAKFEVNALVGDKNYVYEQATASDTWEVTHGLNKKPSITVVDSAENVVVGAYTYLDENRVILKFNSAFVGKAYFN